MTAFQHILLPTDFSAGAEIAARHAAELARRYEATIDVVHVWTPPRDMEELVRWLSEDDSRDKRQATMGEFLKTRSGPLLRELLTFLEGQGVREVRGRLEPGQPSRVILDMAAGGRYDAIVMATHGGTGLAEVLIGSCVERVVRRCPIPVLVVPVPREQRQPHAVRDDGSDVPSGWVTAAIQSFRLER